jgi:hypothetical protein
MVGNHRARMRRTWIQNNPWRYASLSIGRCFWHGFSTPTKGAKWALGGGFWLMGGPFGRLAASILWRREF